MAILVILVFLVSLPTAFFLFMRRKQFGKDPLGEKLEGVRQSINYRDGAFQNPMPTEMMLKDTSYAKLLWASFNKPASVKPPKSLPSVKTDLRNLHKESPVIVWFGHSSYLIISNGFRILVDPVIQGHASPVSFFGKPFAGSDVYSLNDLPPVDLVLLTHDHYDHLHYESIKQLASSATYFCTSLGVASHLEHWGVAPEKITEFDWWETKSI